MSTDLNVQQRVIEELEYDPVVDAAHIGVSVHNGVVTLSGYVEDFTEKRAAESAARRVRGVRAVAQEIEVRLPAHKKTADDEIAARAVQMLQWALRLPPDALQLTVENGFVTLSGEVGWDYQRREAESCVHKLGGVTGIANRIRILPRISAADVRAKIQAAFERAADLDSGAVTVAVVDGSTVVLGGCVRSLHEQIAAENAALSAPGVTAVENHLRVTP